MIESEANGKRQVLYQSKEEFIMTLREFSLLCYATNKILVLDYKTGEVITEEISTPMDLLCVRNKEIGNYEVKSYGLKDGVLEIQCEVLPQTTVSEKEMTVSEVNKLLSRMKQEENWDSAYYYPLLHSDDRTWAIVLGWDYEYKQIMGKIAYLPNNSVMSEYDVDWIMPYDESTGEVYDTETQIGYLCDVEWLLDEWKCIEQKFV